MANEEMIQKHLDNFLAKIAGETPVDDTIQNSTEFWLAQIAEQGGGGTKVIANPTLAGTEDNLEGIEIAGTKYNVPKGAYIATVDGSSVSHDALTYIRNNYRTTPCFVFYRNVLYRISNAGGVVLRSDVTLGYNAGGIGKMQISSVIINVNNGSISDQTKDVDTVAANPSSAGSGVLTGLSIGTSSFIVRDGATHGLGYLTMAPTAANTDGIKIVVLSSEPATKYNGYLYIILA